MVEVNLHEEAGKEWLEIVVEPYPYPVSYKGEYHVRSGSTKQELKGAALDRFLLRKQGRTWDGVPVPHVASRDLSRDALATFRKLARQSGRLDRSVLRESAAGLLEKLRLVDGSHLKRAAVLLFHPDPERFVTGAFVKIGYFRSEADLLYHDEVHGDLFRQARTTLDILLTKYLKAAISYSGLQRIESLPVPEEALREALLNALIHKDYAIGSPIQIRVYEDRLRIWNPGELPQNWSVEQLLGPHASAPFNPALANTFFRAGEIEAWGRGIQRIHDACQEAGAPKPVVLYQPGDFWLEFPFAKSYVRAVSGVGTPQVTPQVTARHRPKTPVETPVETPVKTPVMILAVLKRNPHMTLAEAAAAIGKSLRAVERASARLVREGRLKRVGPAKGGHWEVPK